MTTAESTRFEFGADIRKVLDIVVNSLYTDNDVFVRELISNASDALEKLRYLRLTENDVFEPDTPLEIEVTTDPTAKTLTIRDTGVGITRDELVTNLGTIAHSGSRTFLENVGSNGSTKKLIGQFGVGFYSAFMVADTVTVTTHSWRATEPAWRWTSDGSGSYEIVPAEEQPRGTTIVLQLKDSCADFASDWKIRENLSRYSAFVAFPIKLNGERVNVVEALWLRNRSEVTDEEYADFYKFQAHAYDAPRLRLHFSADAPLSINTLLFVPHDNAERFGLGRNEPAVALYSRRVLIDAHPKELLPSWLRFLRGVVDSEDAPLNISRETMQDRSLMGKLRGSITVRFLRFLEEEAKQRPESYDDFYREFGSYIKEGAALDLSQREPLARLLRFESSATDRGTTTSLADYVVRMKSEQASIYYLIGASHDAIERGPYLEGLRARGLEVLYCFEPVDEYVMTNIHTFDGKKIVAADKAGLELPPVDVAGDAPSAEPAVEESDLSDLTAWMRALDDRIVDVKSSDRLVGSPLLATSADPLVSPHIRRVMRATNRPGATAPVRVNLEINARHSVIRRLAALHSTDAETATLVAKQLLDNALLSAGLLDDPTTMVERLNKLLLRI